MLVYHLARVYDYLACHTYLKSTLEASPKITEKEKHELQERFSYKRNLAECSWLRCRTYIQSLCCAVRAVEAMFNNFEISVIAMLVFAEQRIRNNVSHLNGTRHVRIEKERYFCKISQKFAIRISLALVYARKHLILFFHFGFVKTVSPRTRSSLLVYLRFINISKRLVICKKWFSATYESRAARIIGIQQIHSLLPRAAFIC